MFRWFIRGVDAYLFLCFIFLLLIGWFSLYSSTGADDLSGLFSLDRTTYFGKQSLWIVIALALFLIIQFIPRGIWGSLSWFFYFGSLVLLLLVLLFGSDVKGAQSWLRVGSISIQPSEFAKLSLFLVLSTFLSNVTVSIKSWFNRLIANGLILLPLFFILLQPDAGSALVFLACFLVLYREGYSAIMLVVSLLLAAVFVLTLKFSPSTVLLLALMTINVFWISRIGTKINLLIVYLVLSFCSVIACSYGYVDVVIYLHLIVAVGLGLYLIIKRTDHEIVILSSLLTGFFIGFSFSIQHLFDHFLRPHQQARIFVWLDPSKGDPQGSLYNLLQSKTAIGSGALYGKGYLNGNMTKLNYIPEQNTDFVFSGIAEQFGFVGSILLILLFTVLLLRLVYVAENQKSVFNRVFTYCVTCCIFTHFLINMGMTIGLVPVIGIPLPFISYGGTALLSFTAMLAIVCSLDDRNDV